MRRPLWPITLIFNSLGEVPGMALQLLQRSSRFLTSMEMTLKTRIIAGLLCGLIAFSLCNTAPIQAQTVNKDILKLKEHISKLGTGEKVKVEIKLRDKTTVKGHISQTSADTFTVIDKETGQPKTISYQDVSTVKGPGLSKQTKIIIWSSVAAGVGIALFVVRGAFCDGC
jgi:hypothetical protein